MSLEEIVQVINSELRQGFVSGGGEAPKDHIGVGPKDWRKLALFLRHHERLLFDSMMCITGVDDGAENIHLGVIYNLHSMTHLHKLEVRIKVPKANPVVPSVEQIWRVSDWFEREVYDLYGIQFEGHRDLRRILLPEDWVGYPLRKDYVFPDEWHGIVVPKIKEGWE